jgi:hypothetical protein
MFSNAHATLFILQWYQPEVLGKHVKDHEHEGNTSVILGKLTMSMRSDDHWSSIFVTMIIFRLKLRFKDTDRINRTVCCFADKMQITKEVLGVAL